MERGHIRLWRKSLDSGLLQNSNLWTFWSWCLLKATWKEREIVVNMQIVKLIPGQFIFGRESASSELCMSVRTIRTCLEKLKNMKNLTVKSTNKYSIITIINWDIYQHQRPTNDQQEDQQTTSKRPANDHKQEYKERNNEKIIYPDPEILNFVSGFQNAIKKDLGNLAPDITDELILNGCKTINKLIHKDNFDKDTVFNAIRWAYKDSFWSQQVRSLAYIREKSKKNGLTKFQNIVSAMENGKETSKNYNIPEYGTLRIDDEI